MEPSLPTAHTPHLQPTTPWPQTMTLSKEEKKKLKKLNAPKYNAIKGLDEALFIVRNDSQEENVSPFIEYKPALNDETLQPCMQIFEDNMTELYQQSSWGLDLAEKREELMHKDARFLLVKAESKIIGFCHFRFDVNDDHEPTESVVYVYEIQVLRPYQRYGIGKRLMEIIHLVAKRAEMKKAMLTVFKKNTAAMNFYKKLGYIADKISPNELGIEEDYDILSNVILK